MIIVNKLKKSYGAQLLFEEVAFSLAPGEKVGLVGRNGSGKSTLFRIMLGLELASDGEVQIPKNSKIATVDQHLSFTGSTVLAETVSALPIERIHDEYLAEKILMGLGFSVEDMKCSPSSFSGGYQVRISLAKALLKEADYLLLDEPTNYLDLPTMKWLAGFLRRYKGGVFMITHDRSFMDSIVTSVVGIYEQRALKVKGGTQDYYEGLALAREQIEKMRKAQERRRNELQSFVDRFRAKATKARQAQSRLKMLAKMEVIEQLSVEQVMGLRFHYKEFKGKTLFAAQNLSFSYPESDLLFKNLSFDMAPEDRIGIIGKNGKGKSTLLSLIASELTPNSGEINFHPNVAQGYFGQTNINRLDLDHTIMEEIAAENPNLGTTQVRSVCGAMCFEGDLATKKIRVLSGGERARVLLGKILSKEVNLLLLDEPTNHLDMESIEVLAEEVDAFEGGVVLVTHDERFLRRVCNKLIIFYQGGAEVFQGDYDDFLEKVGWEEESSEKNIEIKQTVSKKDVVRLRQNLINQRSKELKPLESTQAQLEKKIEVLERYVEVIQNEIADLSASNKGSAIESKAIELSSANSKKDELYVEYETLLEQIDQITESFERQLSEIE